MKKNITYFLATLLSVVFLFASCTKKDDSPSYFMKATVGSTAFNGSYCFAISSGSAITISGYNGTRTSTSYPMMAITIPSWDGKTGTITIGEVTSGTTYAQYFNSMTDYKTSTTGTLKITAVSTTNITGSYDFKATDGTTISAGTFSAQRY